MNKKEFLLEFKKKNLIFVNCRRLKKFRLPSIIALQKSLLISSKERDTGYILKLALAFSSFANFGGSIN